MRENHVRTLCSVLKVELVYEEADGSLTAFFDNTDESPLMCSSEIRKILRAGCMSQTAPFFHRDSFDCCFAGFHAGEGILMMGPMAHQRLNTVQRKQMYRSYGVESESLTVLPVFTLPEIRNMILLTNSVLENASLDNEELVQLGRIINQTEQQQRREKVKLVLREEEEDDDDAYRHGYKEEQLLMQAIREGRSADAVRLAESMDRDSGRLSPDYVRHRRNLALIGIALCARAAIEGGVSPGSAYRISGYYIRKCDEASNPAHMLHYRNRAIEELTERVAEKLNKPGGSIYVEQCKAYVKQHYREKLYLEEIAGAIGISPSYLSRLFRRETGICLQDFINEERVFRAENLLLYSDLSLTEIAAYVHFPNQSYFGKIFRQVKGVTPKEFRQRGSV